MSVINNLHFSLKYYPGMFGWHLVTTGDRQVILTTNEKDAMAIYEATKELALALPLADKVDYQVDCHIYIYNLLN
jgi:hypothetical protein